jgi:hypothetical protein
VTNKKRKVTESAEKSMQQHAQYQQESLELQRTIMQQQKQHQKELMQQQKEYQQEIMRSQQQTTLQSALKGESIRQLKLDVEHKMMSKKDLSKELGILKQRFIKHCKCNEENDKQDP